MRAKLNLIKIDCFHCPVRPTVYRSEMVAKMEVSTVSTQNNSPLWKAFLYDLSQLFLRH